MSQPIAHHRVESLVISDDAGPRSNLAEFLNSLTEAEERAAIEFLRSPEAVLFLACREIELDQDDEMGAAS
ncbi:hypothetical protein [Microbispora sp. KK1-11]|uniref:hypothetical protein n=1 Tax=Microbispora sp. KK1-11 TaxID=2053005 RepID=UPI00115B1BAD|nr:hypothetical protein [Microbispora sp. KK1-11]TQS30081.1 hypothetical protein FLW16_06885 [Microbispora sp. KK1-11]